MTASDSSSSPIALFTGASQGIGLNVTRQLAQRGMTVLLTGRSADTTNAAATLSAEGARPSSRSTA